MSYERRKNKNPKKRSPVNTETPKRCIKISNIRRKSNKEAKKIQRIKHILEKFIENRKEIPREKDQAEKRMAREEQRLCPKN